MKKLRSFCKEKITKLFSGVEKFFKNCEIFFQKKIKGRGFLNMFRQIFELLLQTFLQKSEFFILFYNTLVLSLRNYSACFDLSTSFSPMVESSFDLKWAIEWYWTLVYRRYRQFLRTIFYPIPGCKPVALYLKDNFYFKRTRTYLIMLGIFIAFVIWILSHYFARKFLHYFIPLSFMYFFFKLHEFLQVAEFKDWDMLFMDPATVYAHSLIDLHDLTMWYIFIVLGVVYWSLYAIVRNCAWNVANKNFGASCIFYSLRVFSRTESYFVYLWFIIYRRYIKEFFNYLAKENFIDQLAQFYMNLNVNLETEALYFVFGLERSATGLSFPFIYLPNNKHIPKPLLKRRRLRRKSYAGLVKPYIFNRTRMYYQVQEKYLDFRLFNFSTFGEFFYDSKSELLGVRRFRHSTLLEIIWASFPTIIIVLILIPSLYLLYSAEEDLDPEFTLKVIGHQWYWSYEYMDIFNYFFGSFQGSEFKAFNFDSYIVLDDDLKLGEKRLLEVSNQVVLPTNIVLRILVTSGDVLHAWAVPEMGIKVDAVPGRLNQTLSIILRPGVFYGQCSELCGVAHGFMPIVVHAVTPREFGCWGFWQV